MKNQGFHERVRSRRRHIGAGLAVSLLAPLVLVAPIGAETITAANDLDITEVVLDDNGTTVTQSAPAQSATDADTDQVDLQSVTIDDEGTPVVLDNFNVAGPDLAGADIVTSSLGFPDGLTGVRTWENNVPTQLGEPSFEAAAERVLNSTDLRDYIAYDGLSLPLSGQDFDVMFDAPVDNDDYLLVTERNGNTFFDLVPLDATGTPIDGAETVGFDNPYGWNTGYATVELVDQPMWISVTDVEAFNVSEQIWGFRVNNDGEADVKFFAASTEPFTVPVSSIAGSVVVDTGAAIEGVTVELAGTDVDGNSVALTTTTDANGDYAFTGLVAGTYTVTEIQPDGYLDGADVVGSQGGIDTVNDEFSEIVLGVGVDAVDYDFVETLPAPEPVPAPLGTIDGVVWQDADSNGQYNGAETPVQGVVIRLVDSNSNVVATTTTDPNGEYSFIDLPVGEYTVQLDAPAGQQLTVANQGADATDSDFSEGNNTVAVSLPEGGAVIDIDAGLVPEPGEDPVPSPQLALTGVDSWVMALLSFVMIGFGMLQVRLANMAGNQRIRIES